MKHTYTLLVRVTAILLLTTKLLSAQQDAAPMSNTTTRVTGNQSTQALWDIQFSQNITSTANSVGSAGICFLNNEFWISKWASDTIIRFDAAGNFLNKFIIVGLSGTRSLTTDGTYIYASNNTTTLYRIDPATATLAPPHITSGVVGNIRWATYDSTLNSNAGGFWVGNFTTDIVAIDLTGAQLASIPATSHGLTGMYGAAVDNYTAGGPYIWVSNQGGPNVTQLECISIASGTSIESHDVFPDFSTTHSLTSSLAGGAFLTNQYMNGMVTLMTVMQGTPNNVFAGYEVQQPVMNNDIEVLATYPADGLTMYPASHAVPLSYVVDLQSNSNTTIDSTQIQFTILNSANSIVYAETLSVYNVAPHTPYQFYSQAWTAPGMDNYTLRTISVNPATQMDSVLINDTAYFQFAVNDSSFARDLNVPSTIVSVGIVSGDWGYITTNYTTQVPDVFGGIWIRTSSPNAGDTTYAAIFDASAPTPSAQVAQGSVVLIDSTDWYFLPFSSGASLAAGTYAFGCYNPVNSNLNLSIEATPDYSYATNFIYESMSGWTPYNGADAWYIRPLLSSAMLHVADETGPSISVFPNPTSDVVNVFVGNTELKTFTIVDLNGQVVKTFSSTAQNVSIDISGFANGTYLLQISTAGNSWSQPIIKSAE